MLPRFEPRKTINADAFKQNSVRVRTYLTIPVDTLWTTFSARERARELAIEPAHMRVRGRCRRGAARGRGGARRGIPGRRGVVDEIARARRRRGARAWAARAARPRIPSCARGRRGARRRRSVDAGASPWWIDEARAALVERRASRDGAAARRRRSRARTTSPASTGSRVGERGDVHLFPSRDRGLHAAAAHLDDGGQALREHEAERVGGELHAPPTTSVIARPTQAKLPRA